MLHRVAVAVLSATSVFAQAAPQTPGEPIESGKWKLYKFEQAIGQESYEIRLIGACFAGTSAMC